MRISNINYLHLPINFIETGNARDFSQWVQL
jgi:hypothetical protein